MLNDNPYSVASPWSSRSAVVVTRAFLNGNSTPSNPWTVTAVLAWQVAEESLPTTVADFIKLNSLTAVSAIENCAVFYSRRLPGMKSDEEYFAAAGARPQSVRYTAEMKKAKQPVPDPFFVGGGVQDVTEDRTGKSLVLTCESSDDEEGGDSKEEAVGDSSTVPPALPLVPDFSPPSPAPSLPAASTAGGRSPPPLLTNTKPLGCKKVPWTDGEKNAFVKGHAVHGNKWADILLDPAFSSELQRRDKHQLKDKWR